MSCDCGHMPLHHQEKENQKKKNIKSRKIDKRKRKILVLQCTMTCGSIEEQLRKWYIRPSKSPQIALVFSRKEGWKETNSTKL